jgi:hypothetical protein
MMRAAPELAARQLTVLPSKWEELPPSLRAARRRAC